MQRDAADTMTSSIFSSRRARPCLHNGWTRSRSAATRGCWPRSVAVARSRLGGVRSAIAAVVVFVWVAFVSPTLVAQWPSYPTKNVPRGTDGKPNLAEAPPRTADGVPDLTGIWNYAGVSASAEGRRRRRRHAGAGDVLEYRSRIQRGTAVHAVGRRNPSSAHGWQQQGQSRRRMSAARPHAAAHALSAAEDDSDEGPDRHHLRGERQRAAIFLDGRARRTTTRSRGGTAIHAAVGRGTRWSLRRRISATRDGSTSTARR